MKSKTKSKDLARVEKREHTFSTLAKEEGKGAAKRAKQEAKAGLKQSAADSRWETKVDNAFSSLRSHKASAYQKQLDAAKAKGAAR